MLLTIISWTPSSKHMVFDRSDLRESIVQLGVRHADNIVDGHLVLPERLNWQRLVDDDFYEAVLEYYNDRPEIRLADQELLVLLGHYKPRELSLVQLLLNFVYRTLPKECQYDPSSYLEERVLVHSPFHVQELSVHFHEGLILGKHKFLSYEELLPFSYQKYLPYVKQLYFDDDVPPICCDTRASLSYKYYLPDRLEDPRYNEFLLVSEGNKFWEAVKSFPCEYNRGTFALCSEIALDIEKGYPHCFTFAQFIKVFPFMRGMKMGSSSTSTFVSRKPSYFNNYIQYAMMVCSSNYSEEQMRRKKKARTDSPKLRNRLKIVSIDCPVKYKITIDFKHKVVLIRSYEKHSKLCHLFQKRKGYTIMRKLMTIMDSNQSSTLYMNTMYDHSKLEYYGRDQICLKNIRVAKNISTNTRSKDLLGNDYMTDFHILNKLIQSKSGNFNFKDRQYSFTFKEEMVVENIFYDRLQGFLIGSKQSLLDLSTQVVFGIDATFNVTQYRSLKLLTVVYQNIQTRKIVVGCVGFLPGSESTGNYSAFISALKNRISLLKGGEEAFPNLKYIVTDDSKAAHNGLKEHFGSNVKVVKCLWHKRINFETHLDKVGVDIMMKVMWDRNPLKARAWLEALKEYYHLALKAAYMKPRSEKFTLLVYKRGMKKNCVKIKSLLLRRSRYLLKVKSFLNYIVSLESDCESWCLSYRCVLPDAYSIDNVPEIPDEIRKRGVRALNQLAGEEEMSVLQQHELNLLYGNIYLSLANRNEGRSEEVYCHVKELEHEFNKSYSLFTDHLDNPQFGLLMLTTSNNESIHNALKNHYNMKHCPHLVDLYIKLQNYFYSKITKPNFYSIVVRHDFPFVRDMTLGQQVQFNREMDDFTKEFVAEEIVKAEVHGATITATLCGCRVRAKNCVPCRHMLQKLHQSCTREAQSQLGLDLESLSNSDLSVDIVDQDDKIDILASQLLETALKQNTCYRKIVKRLADIENVVRESKQWEDIDFSANLNLIRRKTSDNSALSYELAKEISKEAKINIDLVAEMFRDLRTESDKKKVEHFFSNINDNIKNLVDGVPSFKDAIRVIDFDLLLQSFGKDHDVEEDHTSGERSSSEDELSVVGTENEDDKEEDPGEGLLKESDDDEGMSLTDLSD